MSEQAKAKSFMQELDQWTEAVVINHLHEAVMDGDSADFAITCEQVKKAIRTKVLESYRNGQAAGPRPIKQPQKGGR